MENKVDILKSYLYEFGRIRAQMAFPEAFEWEEALREHFPDIGVESGESSLAPNVQVLDNFRNAKEPHTLYRALTLLRNKEYARREALRGDDSDWLQILSPEEESHVRSYVGTELEPIVSSPVTNVRRGTARKDGSRVFNPRSTRTKLAGTLAK